MCTLGAEDVRLVVACSDDDLTCSLFGDRSDYATRKPGDLVNRATCMAARGCCLRSDDKPLDRRDATGAKKPRRVSFGPQ
jgi:hypothetical protein